LGSTTTKQLTTFQLLFNYYSHRYSHNKADEIVSKRD